MVHQHAPSCALSAVETAHRQVMGRVDGLRAMILTRGDGRRIAERLDELTDFVGGAFASEELAMRDGAHRDWKEHKRQHEALVAHLRMARRSFTATADDAHRGEVFDVLSELLVHTLFED